MSLPIELRSTAYRIDLKPYVSTQDLWWLVDDLEAIKATAGSPVAGVDSINSLNAAAQTLAPVDDTNVTLSINSAISTHTFTLGWTGSLAATRGGTGLSAYTTGDLLYASAANTLSALPIGSNGDILTIVAGVPSWAPSVPDGITSLNAQTGATQTFATGTAGTDFAISSALDVHTFDIPSSSALNRGLLLAADWTTFNNKFDLPALTAGSVLFSNGTNIAQDNANFFYDDTNNRLGLRTSTPSATIDIIGEGVGAAYGLKVSDSGSVLNFYVKDDGTVNSKLGYWIGDDKVLHYGYTNSTSIFVGRNSGTVESVVGNGNAGVGRNALASITDGQRCVGIGYNALSSMTVNGNSVGIGWEALRNDTGGENIGIGSSAAPSLTGTRNTVIGQQSGNTMVAAIRNTLIGAYTDVSSATQAYSIALGAHAIVTADSQWVVGSAAAVINDAYFGQGVSQPSSITDLSFNATSVAAGQTDTNAGNWYFKGGKGTGTGLGSDLIFQVAPAGATGNTQNTLVEILRLKQSRIINAYLQVGNASLASGDLYKDTAANILANGDYVVGMKV